MSMLTKYLIAFFISMVPLVELRAAVPYALAMGLPVLPSYVVCIVGNMLPVPFIFFFARKVLVWGADKPVIGKFFNFCLKKGEAGGEKLQQKAGGGLYIALLLFYYITYFEKNQGKHLQNIHLFCKLWVVNDVRMVYNVINEYEIHKKSQ